MKFTDIKKNIHSMIKLYSEIFESFKEVLPELLGALSDTIMPEYCRLRRFKPSHAKRYQFIRVRIFQPQPDHTIVPVVKIKKRVSDLNFLDPPDFVEEPEMPFIIADMKKLRPVKNRGNYPKTVQLVCLMHDSGVPIVAFDEQSPKYKMRVYRYRYNSILNGRY